MIVDIFALIDNAPRILKGPLLPFSPTSYRIPIYALYNPQAANWPEYPYYHTNDFKVISLLIGGRRFYFDTTGEENNMPKQGVYLVPKTNMYKIHIYSDVSYIVIGIDITTLWMYERIEIIITSKQNYSYYGTKDPDGDPNPPMIISVPDIRKKADALKYAKFSFENIKLSFIKENQSIFLYGGEIVLSMHWKEIDRYGERFVNYPLGRFVMNKITYDMNNVSIEGIDYRYLLNSKFPTDKFTKSEFPYLQDDYIDIIKPVMLGIGNGVPGIPTNGLQIYKVAPEGNFPDKIEKYDFQFPPGWNNLYKVEVKQGDTWTEIYPGLGNPYGRNPNGTDNDMYKHKNPYPITVNPSTGIVKVYYLQALQDGEYGNDPNEIRMYAKWSYSTLKEAISFLLNAADSIYDNDLISGFDGEFPQELAAIGLYLDKAEPIFTWIERLQSSNILGGQLMLLNDVLFYRLENPNREKRIDIPSTDVLNHETLSVTIAEDFMYSGWDITWKKAWIGEESIGHSIGTNYRYPIASIYNSEDLTVRYERQSPTQQVFDTTNLQKRINIIRDLTNTFRHKITGLEMPMSYDYLELLIYDVIGYVPKVLENDPKYKDMEWMIYDIKKNIEHETITLTLIERIRSRSWNAGHE
jgi:hypothetical protein